MTQDPDLPRRRSARLSHFDYSQRGAYFLTVCAFEKKTLFGQVRGHEVVLNATGQVIDDCLREIPVHFPNVELASRVVMPNHVHAIVVVRTRLATDSDFDWSRRRIGALPLASIPAIVRSFKAITTRLIRQRFGGTFVLWQRGYYERVIRGERRISKDVRIHPHESS